MHHQRVLWISLWFLVTQVSSGIRFSCCKPKEEVVLKPISNDGNHTNQMRRIHDDVLKLTDYQKTYAEMFYPIVVYYCGARVSNKHITRLIVTYLTPPLPTEIHTGYKVSKYQLSFDDQWLATTGFDSKNVTLWRMDNGKKHTTLGHTRSVTEFIFTSDSQYIISASWDITLIIWSVRTGNRLHHLRGHSHFIISCSLTADNQRLLSISKDGTGRIWNVQSGKCEAILDLGFFLYAKAKFCNYDQHIFIETINAISLWTVSTGELVRTIPIGMSTFILTMDDNVDIQILLTDYNDSSVQVWDFATNTCLQTFWGHTQDVRFAFFVRGNTGVVSRDEMVTLCIWGVNDGICTHRFHHFFMDKPISYWLEEDDTECIFVRNFHDNALHVLALNSGKKFFTFPLQATEGVQVSFDGRFLVWNSGSEDGTIRFTVFTHHKKNTHN